MTRRMVSTRVPYNTKFSPPAPVLPVGIGGIGPGAPSAMVQGRGRGGPAGALPPPRVRRDQRVDLRCAHCGEPMHAGDIDLLPGPLGALRAREQFPVS